MSFEEAVGFIIPLEGGYSDDPEDDGGRTKFGISQSAFPDIDIKTLNLGNAKEIYRRAFWDKYYCGELPDPLALVLFDSVIQFNPLRPILWLQAAVNAYADGIMGPITVKAARSRLDPVEAACRMMIARGEARITHPDYAHFGKGWRRRDFMVLCQASRKSLL